MLEGMLVRPATDNDQGTQYISSINSYMQLKGCGPSTDKAVMKLCQGQCLATTRCNLIEPKVDAFQDVRVFLKAL